MGTDSPSGASSSSAAFVSANAAWDDLRALVGADHIRIGGEQDAVDGSVPQMVMEPATADEIAQTLKIATGAGLHVVPRGSGTKMDWGNRLRRDRQSDVLILSTRRLNRVVEHAWGDMTATVEAGCTFRTLQETLAEHGQRLALDPLWPERATIGGILAANDSGPLRIRFGSLRDLIIGVTLALPDGTIAKSGGKVVKNVAGYDLPKLATGSLGTLGIITEATFRLHPIPRETRTLSFASSASLTSGSEFLQDLALAIQGCDMVPTGVQIRAASSTAENDLHEIDLRFEGTAAGCEAQIEQALGMASSARRVERPAEVWNACSTLWSGGEPSVICKFSLLPADFASFLGSLKKLSQSPGLRWRLVAQAVGVGHLRMEGSDNATLLSALADLRQQLEARGGAFVILRCPLDLKSKIDVWGSAGDALPLMKSIKARFDPIGTLNPGRFIDGI
jgi:glycolate oxidase FAD binding subunit